MKTFDYIVIGGGSGGIASANRAGMHGAKVLLIEGNELGGTCVNVGCVPKKVMWQASEILETIKRDAASYGIYPQVEKFAFTELVEKREKYIEFLHGAYQRGLDGNKVEVIKGYAQFVDKQTVAVNGEQFTAPHILLATGGRPDTLAIPGGEYAIDSNGFFALTQAPQQMIVLGAGYIAAEIAGVMQGLGTKVSWAFRKERPLRSFDKMLADNLIEIYQEQGMATYAGCVPKAIEKKDNLYTVTFENGQTLQGDCVLFAGGRKPNVDNLGLENTEVKLDERGFVAVDDLYQTAEPSILAIGDVIGRVQLTPVALAEGMAVARRLFKHEQYRPVDYANIATAVFSLPNIGTVGLTEEEARKKGHNVQIFESRFRPMKLTLTDCQEKTLMKLVVDADTDKVLGCHMVGPDAGEIVQGLAIALKAGATKQHFDETIGVHPTAAEEFVTMRTPVAD